MWATQCHKKGECFGIVLLNHGFWGAALDGILLALHHFTNLREPIWGIVAPIRFPSFQWRRTVTSLQFIHVSCIQNLSFQADFCRENHRWISPRSNLHSIARRGELRGRKFQVSWAASEVTGYHWRKGPLQEWGIWIPSGYLTYYGP